jgi:hypothetical protein
MVCLKFVISSNTLNPNFGNKHIPKGVTRGDISKRSMQRYFGGGLKDAMMLLDLGLILAV